jgi:hypothetical protein
MNQKYLGIPRYFENDIKKKEKRKIICFHESKKDYKKKIEFLFEWMYCCIINSKIKEKMSASIKKPSTIKSVKTSGPPASIYNNKVVPDPIVPEKKEMKKKEKEEIPVPEPIQVSISTPKVEKEQESSSSESDQTTEKKQRKPRQTLNESIMEKMKDMDPTKMEDMVDKQPSEVMTILSDMYSSKILDLCKMKEENKKINDEFHSQFNKEIKHLQSMQKLFFNFTKKNMEINEKKVRTKKQRNVDENGEKRVASINIMYTVDPTLTTFLNKKPDEQVSRAEAMKGVTAYIEANNLKNKEVKKQFMLDATLTNLFSKSGQIQTLITEAKANNKPVVLEYKHIFGAISPLFPKKVVASE